MNDWLLAALSGYGLALCRAGGFAAITPLPLVEAPQRMRAALAVLLALVIASSASTPVLRASLEAAPLVLGEIAVGLTLGATTRVVLSAAETFGMLAGAGAGFAFAATYDPAHAEQRDPLARVAQIAVHGLALLVGCHRVAVAALVDSARTLPVGRAPEVLAAGSPLLHLLAEAFELGFRLALPVLVVSAGTQLALGLLSRTAPALQIFNVGLAFMSAAALLAFFAGFDETRALLGERLGALDADLGEVLSRLAGR